MAQFEVASSEASLAFGNAFDVTRETGDDAVGGKRTSLRVGAAPLLDANLPEAEKTKTEKKDYRIREEQRRRENLEGQKLASLYFLCISDFFCH